jgi:hypothetical protein
MGVFLLGVLSLLSFGLAADIGTVDDNFFVDLAKNKVGAVCCLLAVKKVCLRNLGVRLKFMQ